MPSRSLAARDKDQTAVVEKCATVQEWLEDQMARQAKWPE